MGRSRWKLEFLDGSDVKELLLSREPFPSWPYGLLGDLGKIGVLSTRNFIIDSTPESDSFFEYLKDYNVITDITRRAIGLNLLYDGEPVIENAIVNKLEYKNEEYKILLSGKSQNIVNDLAGSIRSLDYSAYEIDNSLDTIQDSIATDNPLTKSGCIYAEYLYKKQDATYEITPNEYLAPFMKVDTILQEIVSNSGYTISDLTRDGKLSSNDYNLLYFSLADRNVKDEGETITTGAYNYNGTGTNIITILGGVSGSTSARVDFSFFEETYFFSKNIANFVTGRIIEVIPNLAGNVNVSSTIDFIENTGGDDVTIKLVDKTGTTKQEFTYNTSGDYVSEFTNVVVSDYFELERSTVTAGNVLRFTWDIDFTSEVKIVGNSPIDTSDGMIFPISFNLPDISQLDFIKFLAIRYAMLIDYDEVNKQIIFYDYEHVADNYQNSNFIDLTSKLVNPKRREDDSTGKLSQSNILKFSNESDVQEDTGEGSFLFSNANAKAESTFYKADFSCCTEINRGSLSYSVINAIEEQEDGTSTILVFKSVGSRLVSVNYDFISGNGNRAVSTQSYFDYAITENYGGYNDSNEDYSVLKAQFDLNYSDVVELTRTDIRQPIVLDYNDGIRQISGVFLLVKIQNFSDNQPATLTLKRLGFNSL